MIGFANMEGKNIRRIEHIENEIIDTGIIVKHLLTEALKRNITHSIQQQKSLITTKPNKIKNNDNEYKTTTAISSNSEVNSTVIWKIVLGKFLKQYNSTTVKSTVNHHFTSSISNDKATQDIQHLKNDDKSYEIDGIIQDKIIQVIGINTNAQRLGTWPNYKKKHGGKSRLKREREWRPDVTHPPDKAKEPSELTLKWRNFVADWNNFWSVDWKAVVFAVKREIGKMGRVWNMYPKKDYLIEYWHKEFTIEPKPNAFTIITKAMTMMYKYVYGIQVNYDDLLPRTRFHMNDTKLPSEDKPLVVPKLWKN